MSDINNPALDTKVTPINPKGRGGWVAVTVAALVTFEGLTNFHGGYSVGTHQSFDPKGINTVCYGHIEDVHIGDKYTKIQCQEMLARDLPKYEAQVERCIHVPMPGYRHAGILSFDYNVGGGVPAKNGRPARGGLCGSSVARYINAGQWEKGCDALLLYTKADGKELPGLVTRRRAERKMCYNLTEPPLPDAEVLAEGLRTGEGNVPSGMNAAPLPKEKPVAKVPLPTAKPIQAPTQKPVEAPATRGGFLGWLMER